MPKNKNKSQRHFPYFRVVVTYIDGETSGHKVFKNRAKADWWAQRQERSAAVKKVTVEHFVRDAYAASRVPRKPKQKT